MKTILLSSGLLLHNFFVNTQNSENITIGKKNIGFAGIGKSTIPKVKIKKH
jgi:hypothetical protein